MIGKNYWDEILCNLLNVNEANRAAHILFSNIEIMDEILTIIDKFQFGCLGKDSGIIKINRKTGDIAEWNGTYDQKKIVNRVHLKSINGIAIDSPHFPPTLRELLGEDLAQNMLLRRGY